MVGRTAINEGSGRYTLIYDQSSTMANMARWMRQAKDNQFLEYPLDESGTPTGEELHSTNGFTEEGSFVDTIQYARSMRDTIFNERRSFGLHIFSPFNFEKGEPAKPWLEVTKKAGEGVSAGDEWTFTVKYTAGAPSSFTAMKNGADCTSQVTETGSSLKFKLKAGETIRIDFDADPSFRCEVTEDDSSQLTGITGTGGTADMTAKKFTTTGGVAKVTFTNGTEPPPPDKPDEPDKPTPTPGKAILFKRDANTNAGVGPATFKFSSVVNGVYEFDTNASGELETIQWWDPTEAAGKYIKPGEYAVSEIVPPPNYLPTTEVQQIKLELDADGNPIPAGPLVFKNQAKVGLRVLKYDRQSHTPMNGVTFEIFKDGVSIGRYETKGQGEILLTGIDPGTYLAVERDTGDAGHLLDASYQEVECAGYVIDDAQRIIHLKANDTAQFVFTNTKKPGFRLVKTSADGSPLDGVTSRIARIEDGSRYLDRTTANGGEISVDGLEPGVWSVTETATLPDHILDKTEYHVELSPGKTSELRLSNNKRPSIEIIKENSITHERQAHVPFQVWYASNNTSTGEYNDLGVFYTDENGRIVLTEPDIFLRDGWFRVKELEAPHGFTLSAPDTQEAFIPSGTSHTFLFQDRPLSAICVWKYDSVSPNMAIEGAVFQIRYLSGNTSGTGGRSSASTAPGRAAPSWPPDSPQVPTLQRCARKSGTFSRVQWVIEGDIKVCFDSFDHHVLIDILRRRIKDEHFIALMWKMLKAGYMEQWTYHHTYSGTPAEQPRKTAESWHL